MERATTVTKRRRLEVQIERAIASALAGRTSVAAPTTRPVASDAGTAAEDSTEQRAVLLADIERGRMPAAAIVAMPAFRAYSAGEPSARLYVKNVAAQATEAQLQRLFRLFDPAAHVELLTHGRMHGQAFVSFASVAQASAALNALHGYVIGGKPLVIQFRRPATQSALAAT